MSGRVWGRWGHGDLSQSSPCFPTHSDPLLAGLPRDPDYSMSCLYSPPSPSSVCLPANVKCDKYWGSLGGCHRAGDTGRGWECEECPALSLKEALTPRLFLGQGSGAYSSLVQDPRARDLGTSCFWGHSEECRLQARVGLGASAT